MKKNLKLIIISLILMILIIILTAIFIIIRSTFSLDDNLKFTTEVYKIEDNYIKNISPNTTIELFKEYFDISDCTIKVVNENNQEINTDYIYTGSITKVYNNQNNVAYTYENIVTGDITDDGLVTEDDLNSLSKILIENTSLSSVKAIAADINDDNEVKINDLTLIEEYLNSKYNTITLNKEELNFMTGEKERIISKLNPSSILNQNVIWTSSNENVAKVTATGIVTAYEEGEATITATTPDGSLSASLNVIVDNTIRLSSNSGKVYVGGDPIEVDIKSLNYNNITCSSSLPGAATCRIENNKLIVIPGSGYGTAIITVTSPEYGEAQYNVETIYTYLNVYIQGFSHEACFLPNTGTVDGLVSGFSYGQITTEISNRNVVIYAGTTTDSTGRTKAVVDAGIPGDAEVKFIGSNGHNTSVNIVHVYKLSLSKTSSTVLENSQEITVDITNENAGDLTCTSSNTESATCQINNNKLIITPLQAGESSITVKGSKCGAVVYRLIVEGSDGE